MPPLEALDLDDDGPGIRVVVDASRCAGGWGSLVPPLRGLRGLSLTALRQPLTARSDSARLGAPTPTSSSSDDDEWPCRGRRGCPGCASCRAARSDGLTGSGSDDIVD